MGPWSWLRSLCATVINFFFILNRLNAPSLHLRCLQSAFWELLYFSQSLATCSRCDEWARLLLVLCPLFGNVNFFTTCSGPTLVIPSGFLISSPWKMYFFLAGILAPRPPPGKHGTFSFLQRQFLLQLNCFRWLTCGSCICLQPLLAPSEFENFFLSTQGEIDFCAVGQPNISECILGPAYGCIHFQSVHESGWAVAYYTSYPAFIYINMQWFPYVISRGGWDSLSSFCIFLSFSPSPEMDFVIFISME